MKPLANKVIFCSFSEPYGTDTVFAKVDANGIPYTRAVSPRYGDTGYIAGYTATAGPIITATKASWTVFDGLTGLYGSGYTCSANWPLT